MNNTIEYVESETKMNAGFHISNADALARESNTFLNIIIVGASGALAYFVNLTDK